MEVKNLHVSEKMDGEELNKWFLIMPGVREN